MNIPRNTVEIILALRHYVYLLFTVANSTDSSVVNRNLTSIRDIQILTFRWLATLLLLTVKLTAGVFTKAQMVCVCFLAFRLILYTVLMCFCRKFCFKLKLGMKPTDILQKGFCELALSQVSDVSAQKWPGICRRRQTLWSLWWKCVKLA